MQFTVICYFLNKTSSDTCACFGLLEGRHVEAGRDSDSVRAGRSADRIPVAARFYALVEIGHKAHPTSCTMGTVSLKGQKWPKHGVHQPHLSRAEVKERVQLYLYSLFWSSWSVIEWKNPHSILKFVVFMYCIYVVPSKRLTIWHWQMICHLRF
jgi:hypothetical protein